MWEVRFGMKLPLYFWGKPRHAVREARERNLGAEQTVRATEQKILANTETLWQEIQTASALVSLYETVILPQARTSYQSALSSYEVGSADFEMLVSSMVSLLKYELGYHKQLVDLNDAVAKLEETVGTDIQDRHGTEARD